MDDKEEEADDNDNEDMYNLENSGLYLYLLYLPVPVQLVQGAMKWGLRKKSYFIFGRWWLRGEKVEDEDVDGGQSAMEWGVREYRWGLGGCELEC